MKILQGAAGNKLVGNEIGHGAHTALLLHGGGQTRHAWAKTARRLAEAGWCVIAVDQRGHGESEWLADGAYAFLDYAADAAAIAKQVAREHGRKPVAVGASLGGIASLLALGRSPEPVFSGLILVDVVPRAWTPGASSTSRVLCAPMRRRASRRWKTRPTLWRPTCRTARAQNPSTA
jgi:pimeloyl-ACP methyl ester carboxylesterase